MKKRHSSPLRLEVLEDRCVPALNPLTYDAAGNLSITGTLTYDNLVLDYLGGNAVHVTDQNTAQTLTKDYGTYQVDGGLSATLGNAVTTNPLGKGVIVNLGINNTADFLSLNLGNVVNTGGGAGYNVTISNNDPTGTPQATPGTISGVLTVNTGTGNDSVTINNVNVSSGITSNLNTGRDTFSLNTTPAITGDIDIGDNVSVTNVNDLELNTAFPLTAVHIEGNLTVSSENNTFGNNINIGDLFVPLDIAGSVFMTSGSTGIFLTQVNINADIGENVTANLGTGNNALTIDASSVVGGNLSYVGANNNNHITLATGSVIGGNVGVYLGNGTNTFDFNNIVLGSSITFQGGTHADTLNISGQAPGANLRAICGAGTNTINLSLGVDLHSMYLDFGRGKDTLNQAPGVIITWPTTLKNF